MRRKRRVSFPQGIKAGKLNTWKDSKRDDFLHRPLTLDEEQRRLSCDPSSSETARGAPLVHRSFRSITTRANRFVFVPSTRNLGPHAENGRNSCFKWEASHETHNGVHVRRKRLLADLGGSGGQGGRAGGTWRFIASNVSSSGISNCREAAIAMARPEGRVTSIRLRLIRSHRVFDFT